MPITVSAGTTVGPDSGSTPPAAVERGALPIGLATYSVPAGAIYADPDLGSDVAGTGTAGNPFATCAAAVSACPTGGTVVLRAGVYHEGGTSSYSNGILFNKAGMTVQNYPGEAVWFDGSSVVTGWEQSGAVWVRTGWTVFFNRDYTYSQNSTTNTDGFVSATYPCAHMPDMVFVDGSPLQQVANAAEVGPGEFHADPATQTLTIGTNPTGREVRVSDRNVMGILVAENVTLRGVGVRRYANPLPTTGALRIHRAHCTLENVHVEQCATAGIGIIGPSVPATGDGGWDATVTHCTSQGHGLMGLHGWRADVATIEHSIFDGNNVERFNAAPSSGGVKVTKTQGITFKNCQFNGNVNSSGLWLDEVVHNYVIVSNDMCDNAFTGLNLEISGRGYVADNLMTGNAVQQILVQSTTGVEFWCNTFAGNVFENVVFQQDNRDPMIQTSVRDSRMPDSFYEDTCTWWMDEFVWKNNVIGESRYAPFRVKQYNYTGGSYVPLPSKGWGEFGFDADGNLFNRTFRTSTTSPGTLVTVWGAGVPGTESYYSTLAAWRTGSTALGQSADANSAEIQGATVLDSDWMLTPDTETATAGVGRPLSSTVAAMIGQTAGSTHLGCWRD